ncbi:MAG: hypothetical protein JWN85_4825 [Gammaproteobacteria bacterium]|nr:hypothetical protein [Gammaproteobacteria bacterium]
MFSIASQRAGALCLFASLTSGSANYANAAHDPPDNGIRLELSPRICTLAIQDKQCETKVHAQWTSPHEESLCLVIVDRPEVKRCWEHYSHGTYSIELTFAEDLTFQLRDLALQNVLASEALRVIREALRYRHKRRQPWNIFD